MTTVARTSVVAISTFIAASLSVGAAFAYWSTTGTGSAAASTGTLAPATAVSAPATSGSSVPVNWAAPTAPGSGGSLRYYLTRTTGSTTATAGGTCGTPSAPISATSCTDSGVSSGSYTYKVVTLFNSWATTSAPSGTVAVSAASKLALTSTAVSGAASSTATLGPVTVQLQDATSNPATAAGSTTVTLSSSSTAGVFAASSGGTSVTTVTTVTIPAGSSSTTFYYGDTQAGTPTITAAASPLSYATQTETVTAAAGTTVSTVSGTSQSAAVGTSFTNPLVAQVTDTYGNPVSGATVTFTAPSSGASGAFANGTVTVTVTVTTGTTGQGSSAAFTANGIAGSYNVSAASPGVATPASFTLTNLVGPASTVSAASGTPQSAAVTNAYASPVVALVADSYGNPVSGATVTFTAPTAGASGTFARSTGPATNTITATTGSDGRATSSTFTANTTAGPVSITATTTGATSASFALTNTPAAASKLALTVQPTSTVAGVSISPSPTVQIQDQYGNATTSTANVSIAFGTNPSAGTLSGAATVAAVNGTATFPGVSINKVGTGYTLVASSTSLPGTTSSPFNITPAAASKLALTATTVAGPRSTTANIGPTTVALQDSFGNADRYRDGHCGDLVQVRRRAGGSDLLIDAERLCDHLRDHCRWSVERNVLLRLQHQSQPDRERRGHGSGARTARLHDLLTDDHLSAQWAGAVGRAPAVRRHPAQLHRGRNPTRRFTQSCGQPPEATRGPGPAGAGQPRKLPSGGPQRRPARAASGESVRAPGQCAQHHLIAAPRTHSPHLGSSRYSLDRRHGDRLPTGSPPHPITDTRDPNQNGSVDDDGGAVGHRALQGQ